MSLAKINFLNKCSFVLLSLFFLFCHNAPANAEQVNHVQAKLLANVNGIVPASHFKLGVELAMQPGWHTYYKESGEAGMPTKIEWTLPKGFKASELKWQRPSRFNDAGIITYGYLDKTLIVADIDGPTNLTGKQITFSAKVKWVSCKEICIPGTADISLTLPVISQSEITHSHDQEFGQATFDGPASELALPEAGSQANFNILDNKNANASKEKNDQSLIVYIALAFVGGLLLNFMPCVLPVISIKVFNLIEEAKNDRGRIIQQGLVFSAGIIASFLALALIVIFIQQTGQKVGWGFQFQYPLFVFAMTIIVFLFALSFFGLFYVQIPSDAGSINRLAAKEGLSGTFFKGVLATVLSTPCTAPFLGTALGFAFVQPYWVILSIFISSALGMSFPYLLLTANPKLMSYLPKPGLWMEKFKEGMGFLLLATVAWLLYVLGNQVSFVAVISTIAYLVSLAFVVWFYNRFIDLGSKQSKKITVTGICLIVFLFSSWIFIAPHPELVSLAAYAKTSPVSVLEGSGEGIQWQPFSVEAINRGVADGKTVFIDFTADWCLTCKVNEAAVLNQAAVIAKFQELKVLPIKADWTRQDPEITALLQKFGRSGVPLYVILPASNPEKPIVLPEIITETMVLNKLQEAGPSK